MVTLYPYLQEELPHFSPFFYQIGDLVVMMSPDPRPLKRKPQNGVKSKPRPRSLSTVWVPPRYEESVPNIPRRSTPAVHIDRDSNVNGQRGTFSRGSGAYQVMECEPGPSGVNKNPRSTGRESKLEPQPGPSGVSKQANPSRLSVTSNVTVTSNNSPMCSSNSIVSSPGRSDNQDNQGTSPPSPNVHNWDRLRPINRLPSGENRVGNIQLAAFQDQDQAARTCPNRARERQLQALQRFEERIRFNNNQARAQESSSRDESSSAKLQKTMVVCVMDISDVLKEECSVRWLALSPDACPSGPEETILYTLVAGRGELIMYGGIHREAMTLMTNSQSNNLNLSNSLHFISAPHGVI